MKSKDSSIVFTGDIGFDKYMDGKWEDDEFLSPAILDFLHSANHVCANVEGSLFEAPEDDSRSAFFHCMNPKATRVFKSMHADIWNIANNHIMDAGPEGMTSTKKIAREFGALTLGAGLNIEEATSPVYLDEAGGIGIISVGYTPDCIPATEDTPGSFSYNDFDNISKRIKEIKARARWCIIVSHGGEEFAPMPSTYTRDRYIKYLDMGADVVVGHHPHVPENYELFEDGKVIFYSLGNFIFDTNYQRAHQYTERGILLKLKFTEDSMDFEALGTIIDRKTERIDSYALPEIFTNVNAKEYELLSPLAAKAFVEEDRKTMLYLYPEEYGNATDEKWHYYYFVRGSEGYVKGEHMDFELILPLAEKADSAKWELSSLNGVKKYLLSLLS